MSLLPELPEFPLSIELAKRVGIAWGATINQRCREDLEAACRMTIMGLRADAMYRRDGWLVAPPEGKKIRKRHARIGQMAKKLRDLLAEDLHPPSFFNLNVALHRHFGEHGADILTELIVTLTVVSKIAQKSARKGPAGRPKSNDGWDYFIKKVARCYEDLTNKPASATWNKSSSQYDGPFLRGLFLLHDAFPADVRSRSSSFLGSRAADRLVKSAKPNKAEKVRRSLMARRNGMTEKKHNPRSRGKPLPSR